MKIVLLHSNESRLWQSLNCIYASRFTRGMGVKPWQGKEDMSMGTARHL